MQHSGTEDPFTLVTSNWVGSAVVAGTGLVLSAAISLVCAVLIRPDELGLDLTLTLFQWLWSATFGADFVLEASAFSASASWWPLTVTALTLGVMGVLFRRMIRTHDQVALAFADVLRVSVLTALPVFAGSILFRADLKDVDDFLLNGLLGYAGLADDEALTFGASIPGSLIAPFLLVGGVLSLVVVTRGGWGVRPVDAVADWLAVPLRAAVTLVGLLPILAVVGFLLGAVSEDRAPQAVDVSDDRSLMLAVGLAGLVNTGPWLLSLGVGAPILKRTALGEEQGVDRSGLADLAREAPFAWLLPVVVVATLALIGYLVVRWSGGREQVVRHLAVTWLVLVIAYPLLFWVSGVGLAGKSRHSELGYSYQAGPSLGEGTAFLAVATLVVFGVLALVRGMLPGQRSSPGQTLERTHE